MKTNSKLTKVFLSVIILSSSIVLIGASYKQIKRTKAEKNVAILSSDYYDSQDSILYSLEKDNKPFENVKENEITNKIIKEDIYSITENPHKKWIDQNEDYEGWLTVKGTKIDYPVVKTLDNEFYLDKGFEKEKTDLGSIFMDYRNIGNFNDLHTIIYGHYTKSGVMFGDLHKYKDKDFSLSNSSITFNSLYSEKEFEIFSVYVDSADDYKLEYDFTGSDEYENYLNMLSEKSMHDLGKKINKDKLLLTLATCSYEIGNGRLIIHAIEK